MDRKNTDDRTSHLPQSQPLRVLAETKSVQGDETLPENQQKNEALQPIEWTAAVVLRIELEARVSRQEAGGKESAAQSVEQRKPARGEDTSSCPRFPNSAPDATPPALTPPFSAESSRFL